MASYVVDNERKLIAVRDNALRNEVPEELVIGHTDTATVLAHNDTSVKYLRGVERLEVPLPLHSYYKWPCPPNKRPFDHQKNIFTPHMVMNHRCFVWGEMGTGKSAATTWAMDWAMKHQGAKKILILCTLSTLIDVWHNEVKLFCPHIRTTPLKGTPANKLKLLNEGHDIYVSTHQGLLSFMYTDDELKKIRNGKKEMSKLKNAFEAIDWDLVIIDEHTYYRNHSASRTELIKKLTAKPERRIWMLSGAPMPNSVTDMYVPGRIICGDRFPRYFTHYRDRLMTKQSQFKWVTKRGAEEEVYKMVGDLAVKVRRDDCLDLPDTMFAARTLEPTKEQDKLQKELIREMAAEIEETKGRILVANAGTLINKLCQIHSGAVKYVDPATKQESWHPVDSNKFSELEALAEKTDGPVIVFAPTHGALDVLCSWARKHKHEYARIDGSVGASARSKRFDKLRSNEIKFLFAQPAAMAHGVTLVESNTVIWWGLVWDNDVYAQANARITRPGQKRKTFVLHLLSSPQEKKVLNALRKKTKSQDLLLDLVGAV